MELRGQQDLPEPTEPQAQPGQQDRKALQEQMERTEQMAPPGQQGLPAQRASQIFMPHQTPQIFQKHPTAGRQQYQDYPLRSHL